MGRDVLSRLMTGARATIPLALLATLLGTLAGAVIGTLSAYLGGGGTRRSCAPSMR
jgi:peptide/nickel transport system permease protein